MRLPSLFSIAFVIFYTAPAIFAQQVPQVPRTWTWSIDAALNPDFSECPDAIARAREFFLGGKDCAGLCPAGQTLIPDNPVCVKRPPGIRGPGLDISIPYTCREDGSDGGCDQAAEMKDGKPVFPPGAEDIESLVDVNEDRGFLSSLYPGFDTTTDEFYPLPCEPSIGGELPPGVDEPPTKEEIETEEFLDNFETTEGPKIVEELTVGDGMAKFAPITAAPSQLPCRYAEITSAGSVSIFQASCDDPRFLRADQPFEGRDIIYVHGFFGNHVQDLLTGNTDAQKKWPDNSAAFLDHNGYFRDLARLYWADHIRENLFDPDMPSNSKAGWQWTSVDLQGPRYNPKSNRYLIVAWSSNQTLEYAQHAMLEQIRQAIDSNKNVETPPSYPMQYMPFCGNGCIIISHSTGGLVVNTALARASEGDFGPGGIKIPGYIRTHVAFEGAMAGSRLATLAMAVGVATIVPQGACNMFNQIFRKGAGNCFYPTAFVMKSIFRDLMPFVAQGVWGRKVGGSPVPTLTVAGGDPVGNVYGLTKILLPGLDDGVVSMNSACGNPNPVHPRLIAPSGMIVWSYWKAFDFSDNGAMLARGVKNFISHKNLLRGGAPTYPAPGSPGYLAGACTPHVSPTGMVMPVLFALRHTPWSTRARYNNHYSFIQGSIDHYYDGQGDGNNNWPSAAGLGPGVKREYLPALSPNTEESSAVTNKKIYRKYADGTYLVHPSFGGLTREIVRGKSRRFKLFGKPRRIWFWKRTYHLLDKWEQKQSSHYVYEFVGRR